MTYENWFYITIVVCGLLLFIILCLWAAYAATADSLKQQEKNIGMAVLYAAKLPPSESWNFIHAWYMDDERLIKENWPTFAYSRYKIVPDEDDED